MEMDFDKRTLDAWSDLHSKFDDAPLGGYTPNEYSYFKAGLAFGWVAYDKELSAQLEALSKRVDVLQASKLSRLWAWLKGEG